jgi:hypothetical protein
VSHNTLIIRTPIPESSPSVPAKLPAIDNDDWKTTSVLIDVGSVKHPTSSIGQETDSKLGMTGTYGMKYASHSRSS